MSDDGNVDHSLGPRRKTKSERRQSLVGAVHVDELSKHALVDVHVNGRGCDDNNLIGALMFTGAYMNEPSDLFNEGIPPKDYAGHVEEFLQDVQFLSAIERKQKNVAASLSGETQELFNDKSLFERWHALQLDEFELKDFHDRMFKADPNFNSPYEEGGNNSLNALPQRRITQEEMDGVVKAMAASFIELGNKEGFGQLVPTDILQKIVDGDEFSKEEIDVATRKADFYKRAVTARSVERATDINEALGHYGLDVGDVPDDAAQLWDDAREVSRREIPRWMSDKFAETRRAGIGPVPDTATAPGDTDVNTPPPPQKGGPSGGG